MTLSQYSNPVVLKKAVIAGNAASKTFSHPSPAVETNIPLWRRVRSGV